MDGLEIPFDRLVREYVVFFLQRFPVVATYLGGAAFDPELDGVDGRLRDYSASALQAESVALAEFKGRFGAIPNSGLDDGRRIDTEVALAQIEFMLRLHEVRRYEQRSLDSYMEEPFCGVEWQIQGMTSTGRSTIGTNLEWQRVVARVRAIPQYLDVAAIQLQAGVRSGNTPDWRMLIQSGLSGSLANAAYFGTTLEQIAAANVSGDCRNALLAQIATAGKAAADAFAQFRRFVCATYFDDPETAGYAGLKEAFRSDNYAAGTDEYNWALRNNLRLAESAEQLFESSWPQVQQTRAEIIVLAGEIADARGWPNDRSDADIVALVLERLGSDAPRSDGEMLDSYRRIGARLVEYSRRSGLFDVPADYQLDVVVTPQPLRTAIDCAGYVPAPPFKRTGVGRFYVTPTGDDPETLKQQHNYHAMAVLAAHEGFPGHDWHYKVMANHRDAISPLRWLTPGGVNESSSMWLDSMSMEGWALYAEALPADARPGAPTGFYSREERLYQLRALLLRDLRVYLDVGLHIGKLSFEEAVTLFSEIVDFMPGSCSGADDSRTPAKCASCKIARVAATRYSRLPTQAITYRIGRDQILALRAQARKELGERFAEKQFHLEFMKQGTIATSFFAAQLVKRLAAHADHSV